MRLKKPVRAAFDQVRITRENTTAIIEHADEGISGMNLVLGEKISGMTDHDILDAYNDIIAAQEQSLRDWDNTVTEIPPGKPQIKFDRDGGRWEPRGDVVRCVLSDSADGLVMHIDDNKLSWREFGDMLKVYSGWGLRIAIVPDELVHENPKVAVHEPRKRRR